MIHGIIHIDAAALAEYWLGTGDDDAVEEHLFACSSCAESFAWVVQLAAGVREVVRRGNLSVIYTPEFLTRLAASGLRVRAYAPPPDGAVSCTITPADDLLIGTLRADLSAVSRLDVLLFNKEGQLFARLEDVPFRAALDAAIALNQPVDHARELGHDRMVARLVSVEDGADRVIAAYTFNHSPTAG